MNTPIEEAFNKEISSLAPGKRVKLSISHEHSVSTGSDNPTEATIMCMGRNISGNTCKFASLHMDVKEKKSFKENDFQNKTFKTKNSDNLQQDNHLLFICWRGKQHEN